MIIQNDKRYETNSLYPDTDWYNDGNLIIDETTPEGKQMAEKYVVNYPFVDIKTEGQMVTEVIVLDKPVKPPEVEGKRINLVKDETGQWVYVYEDTPLSEVEILKEELAEQKALINAILGVTE